LSSERAFRIIKSEFRVIGIDDGRFIPHKKGEVIVVGVVFRGGASIEGVMHTKILVDGLDATIELSKMINSSPHRRQVRLIMLNGLTLAGFNVVDIKHLNEFTGIPVLVFIRKKPDMTSIYEAIKCLPNSEDRWQSILNAGKIFEVRHKEVKIYLELAGLSLADAVEVLAVTSRRASLPEPLRVAHLIASGITS